MSDDSSSKKTAEKKDQDKKDKKKQKSSFAEFLGIKRKGVTEEEMKVRAFPCTGELYASMLSAYYLTNFPLTEAEMMDEFGLERSTLYRRKREAIKVFGLAIWGGSIEEFRELMIPSKEEQQMMFDTWI